jgi:hypothetical protein
MRVVELMARRSNPICLYKTEFYNARGVARCNLIHIWGAESQVPSGFRSALIKTYRI